jgi:hypothetical protein
MISGRGRRRWLRKSTRCLGAELRQYGKKIRPSNASFIPNTRHTLNVFQIKSNFVDLLPVFDLKSIFNHRRQSPIGWNCIHTCSCQEMICIGDGCWLVRTGANVAALQGWLRQLKRCPYKRYIMMRTEIASQIRITTGQTTCRNLCRTHLPPGGILTSTQLAQLQRYWWRSIFQGSKNGSQPNTNDHKLTHAGVSLFYSWTL